MSGPISQVIACEHNSPLKFYEGILAALGTDHVDSELPLKPFTECGIGTTNNNTLTIVSDFSFLSPTIYSPIRIFFSTAGSTDIS